MSAAYGYGSDDLKPFAHSLRKYYTDEVIFVVKELTEELKDFADLYNIKLVSINHLQHNNDIQWKRYSIFSSILQACDVDRVFISDVRDVVFQDDPFKFTNINFDLEFFEEPEIIRNCNCNAGWIMSLYGPGELNNIGDNNIICSGTSMGSKEGMLNYFEIMTNEILSFSIRGIQIKGGEDQPIHNYLIRHGKFKNYTVYGNCSNSVATLDHQKQFTFNDDGKLMNKSDHVVPIVHQWDRPKQHSDHFLKIAME
jgi:hypothetical protein